MHEGVLRARAGQVVGMFQITAIMQKDCYNGQFPVPRGEYRLIARLVPPLQYMNEANRGLQRMLEIVVRHVDGLIARIASLKHIGNVGHDPIDQRQAGLSGNSHEGSTNHRGNGGGIPRVNGVGWYHFTGKEIGFAGRCGKPIVSTEISMVSSAKLTVGLTGGMGSGKSTAAGMFADRGFQLLDSDQTIRDELLTNPEVIGAIRERFGAGVLAEDGRVRRDRVADVVFQDAGELAWLENLLYPRLLDRWRQVLATSGTRPVMIEVPLLFEKGLEIWFDFIVCVSTDSESRLRRLEQRGIPRELAHQRLAKQLPLARKCELADFVLLNDGSPEFLREQVAVLAERLLKS